MGPRIFCIPASRAPVVAVIRRGPSAWMHLGRWDLAAPAYEPGGWLRGTIYPQRCDLSPDGRWFAYFAMKQSAEWELGSTYIAISRLPWLTALAAWGIGSTWTRGMQFVDDASVRDVDEPDLGDLVRVHERFGLRMSHADSFAIERRRGWTETADTPRRDPGDAWDEARGDRIVMERVRPGSAEAERLTVRGTYAAIRELHGVGRTSVTSSTEEARPRPCTASSGRTGTRRGGSSLRPRTAACRSVRDRTRPRPCGRPTRVRSSPIRPRRPLTQRAGDGQWKEEA